MARASALHAEGQRFDSVILHQKEAPPGLPIREEIRLKGYIKKTTYRLHVL